MKALAMVFLVAGCASAQLRVGALDGFNCSHITGWAYDPNISPEGPSTVELFDVLSGQTVFTGTTIGTASANLYRIDIVGQGGNGYHAFDFATPQSSSRRRLEARKTPFRAPPKIASDR